MLWYQVNQKILGQTISQANHLLQSESDAQDKGIKSIYQIIKPRKQNKLVFILKTDRRSIKIIWWTKKVTGRILKSISFIKPQRLHKWSQLHQSLKYTAHYEKNQQNKSKSTTPLGRKKMKKPVKSSTQKKN